MTTGQNPTPIQALAWAAVALLVALLATGLGQMLGKPHDGGAIWLVKGLLALTASGYVGALVAGWVREAIFGQKTQKETPMR